MERLTASQARDDFATVVNRVAFGRERLVIQRRGNNMVALISMEDLVYLMPLRNAKMSMMLNRHWLNLSGLHGRRPRKN